MHQWLEKIKETIKAAPKLPKNRPQTNLLQKALRKKPAPKPKQRKKQKVQVNKPLPIFSFPFSHSTQEI